MYKRQTLRDFQEMKPDLAILGVDKDKLSSNTRIIWIINEFKDIVCKCYFGEKKESRDIPITMGSYILCFPVNTLEAFINGVEIDLRRQRLKITSSGTFFSTKKI